MIGLGAEREFRLHSHLRSVATLCFASLLLAVGCSSDAPPEDTATSQSTSPSTSQPDTQATSESDAAAIQLNGDNLDRADSIPIKPSSPSVTTAESSSQPPAEDSSADAITPSAPRIAAEEALKTLREEVSFTAFLDPLDYDPDFNEELFRAGNFTDEQLVLIKKAHKQHIRLGAERLILIDELYPDDPERYRTDDDPQNKAQFDAIDRKIADLGVQTSQRLWEVLSNEQRCQLLAFSHGADAIFHPTVQKTAGITDEQLLKTALNVFPHWKAIEESRSQQDQEVDYREAIAAAENLKTTGTLGTRGLSSRMDRMRQLEQAASDSHWLLFDERQLAALRKLGLKNAFTLSNLELLAPHEMRADVLEARIQLLPDARRELKLPDHFVVIRGLIRRTAQKLKFAELSTADGTIEVLGDLRNFEVQRQARAIGTAKWEDWHPIPLDRMIEVLGLASFELDSLRDAVVTGPLPYLESGSWESVTGHPKVTPDSGEVILRFLDVDAVPGNEYRYRARVTWHVHAYHSRPRAKENPQENQDSAITDSPSASQLGIGPPSAGYPGSGSFGAALGLGNTRTRLCEKNLDTPFSEPTPAIAIRE